MKPTISDLGLNPRFRGEKPESKRLSCGTGKVDIEMIHKEWGFENAG
jgi:hypothetical protein